MRQVLGRWVHALMFQPHLYFLPGALAHLQVYYAECHVSSPRQKGTFFIRLISSLFLQLFYDDLKQWSVQKAWEETELPQNKPGHSWLTGPGGWGIDVNGWVWQTGKAVLWVCCGSNPKRWRLCSTILWPPGNMLSRGFPYCSDVAKLT